jgi:hypothetical protein
MAVRQVFFEYSSFPCIIPPVFGIHIPVINHRRYMNVVTGRAVCTSPLFENSSWNRKFNIPALLLQRSSVSITPGIVDIYSWWEVRRHPVCVRAHARARACQNVYAYNAYPTNIKEIGTDLTCFQNNRVTGLYNWRPPCLVKGIAGLHPQSPSHFARQPSARVSQSLRPSYLSHVTAAAT